MKPAPWQEYMPRPRSPGGVWLKSAVSLSRLSREAPVDPGVRENLLVKASPEERPHKARLKLRKGSLSKKDGLWYDPDRNWAPGGRKGPTETFHLNPICRRSD